MLHAALMVWVNTVALERHPSGHIGMLSFYGLPFKACCWEEYHSSLDVVPLGLIGNLAALILLLAASYSVCETWLSGDRERAGSIYMKVQGFWIVTLWIMAFLGGGYSTSFYASPLNGLLCFWIFFGLNLLVLPILSLFFGKLEPWRKKQTAL